MPDIVYTKPYPSGFQNKPSTATPFTAAIGNNFQDGIAAATTQANLALATALAGGGGGGGGGGVTVTPDAGGLFATVTPTAGSSTTITDHSTYVTIT